MEEEEPKEEKTQPESQQVSNSSQNPKNLDKNRQDKRLLDKLRKLPVNIPLTRMVSEVPK